MKRIKKGLCCYTFLLQKVFSAFSCLNRDHNIYPSVCSCVRKRATFIVHTRGRSAASGQKLRLSIICLAACCLTHLFVCAFGAAGEPDPG